MPSNAVRAWSPERDAALVQLWADRSLSAAEIGRRLGVSKSSVLGRSHRLRLPARASPIRRGEGPKVRQPRPARSTLPPEKMAPAPKPASPVPQPPEPVTAVERLQGPCCWPIGHPGTQQFSFCGELSRPGKPYCEKHCQRAYVGPSSSKAVVKRSAQDRPGHTAPTMILGIG
jgi:GcrA cell cycle regulator